MSSANFLDPHACADRRYDLIARRLSHVIRGESIQQLLEQGKTPKGYWATAPTGIPHIAYFVPLMKLAEFAKAGVDTTVLFCDLYAFLVNHDTPFEIVAQRTRVYRFLIRAVLSSLGVPEAQVNFANGSDYECRPSVVMDTFRLAAIATQDESRDTASEYAKSNRLGLLWCPLLPGLAEEYLDADFQFGGEDQEGLFEFNARFLPCLGYRRRAHLMSPMVAGLQGPKMSSSVQDSKIELLDPPEIVRAKVAVASCPYRQVENNGLLSVLRHIIFPAWAIKAKNSKERSDAIFSAGEPLQSYDSYAALEADFVTGTISSQALREAVTSAIIDLLKPIRDAFSHNPEWKNAQQAAYQQRENWDLRQEAAVSEELDG